MKNLILSATLMISFVLSATTAKADPVSEKVQSKFVKLFSNVVDVSWSNAGKNYDAFFVLDNIKTRATFDSKGNLIQTIRYFGGEELPENVLKAIKSEYKGKEIHGATEVINKYGSNYRIVLKDSKYYTHINANSEGETQLVSEFKRADK